MDINGTTKVSIDMSMFKTAAPSRLLADNYHDSYIYIKIPVLGRIRCIKDKNGLLSLLCVYLYWTYGTFATLFIVLIPAYYDGLVSFVLIFFYMSISFLCLTSLIRASTLNPGRVPNIDNTQVIDESWTFCQICQRKRPMQAHHCRRCRQCVQRMDHHCPWINNCVGEENHYSFMLLLLYASLLGLLSFVMCMMHFWVLPRCITCDREVFYIKHSIWFMYLLTALGFNMTLVMGVQLLGQHFNLLIDRTTLQNMVGMPDEGSVKVRGCMAAYKELFGRNAIMCWWLPCRGRRILKNYSINRV